MVKILLNAIFFVCLIIAGVFARTEPFILGADISWIPQREAGGVRYADNGQEKDIFLILKEHRFNWIRLRLFVDPKAVIPNEKESPYSAEGFCDLEQTRAMAKRVKDAGMKLLLDFHYSDTWADPAKQYKPMSWQTLSFNQLKEKVRTYTRETLELFELDGTLPDMVQVGNEIVGGMIWPDGRISNISNLAALINAGIDGVKDVDTTIEIMIHSISKNSPSSWLKSLVNAGVNRIDVFGLSYYSEWHGTPDDLQRMVNDIITNHRVKIAIAEYADNHRRINDIMFNLPDERGVGTFFWEPADWNEALFDWTNGRRETNSRIDLYPLMSKSYGNDDFVKTNYDNVTTANMLENQNVRFIQGNAIEIRKLDKNTEVTLFTLNGNQLGKWKNLSTGYHHLKLNAPIRNGIYLLLISTPDNVRKAHLVSRYR